MVMMTPAELRAKLIALHDVRRVERAEDGALFACALAVYEGASARRERAQAALLEALELESDWAAIVHGMALRLAATIDRSRSPKLQAEHEAKTSMITQDDGTPEGG